MIFKGSIIAFFAAAPLLSCNQDDTFRAQSARPRDKKPSINVENNGAVRPPVLKLEISPPSADLLVGLSQQFTATLILPDAIKKDVTQQAQWATVSKTSNIFSLVVDNPGLAKAESIGADDVTVTYEGLTASSAVTVRPAEIIAIAVTPEQSKITSGSTQLFVAMATFKNGGTRDVTKDVVWSTAAKDVATIESGATKGGIATGVSQGATAVIATLSKLEGSAQLTVQDITVTSLEIAPLNPSVALPNNQKFTATAVYSNGARGDVTATAAWASSNTNVADFGASGMVAGQTLSKTPGVTTVSASFGGKSASTTLTVTAAKLTAIEITPINTVINANHTLKFTATGTYEDGSKLDITTSVVWSSTSASVASISNAASSEGTATGIAAGSVIIRATLSGLTSNDAMLTVLAAPPPGKSFTLSIAKNGSGTVTGSGVNCGATCSQTYNDSTVVVLTATPAVGSTFTGWGGSCVNATGTCSVTMDAARAVTANFVSSMTVKATGLQLTSFAKSDGTPGNAKVFVRLTRGNANHSASNAQGHSISGDFKVSGFAPGTSALNASTGLYEQNFEVHLRYRFVPLNQVAYTNQIFRVTVTDAVTNQTATIDFKVTLYLCREEHAAQCGTGASNGTVDGTATHPLAVGNL